VEQASTARLAYRMEYGLKRMTPSRGMRPENGQKKAGAAFSRGTG
jgi:hypothetical protein